jgi:hypothetical protein
MNKMAAKGINIAEECHVINILSPQDVDGGVESDVFSMKNHGHATIIVTAGTTNSDAGNITIEECDNFTPSNSTAIAFSYYKEETDGGDTLSAKQSATTAGIDVSANDNTTHVIEIDAAELTDGYPNLRLCWSDPGGATYGSAVAILSGTRYAKSESATAIA